MPDIGDQQQPLVWQLEPELDLQLLAYLYPEQLLELIPMPDQLEPVSDLDDDGDDHLQQHEHESEPEPE